MILIDLLATLPQLFVAGVLTGKYIETKNIRLFVSVYAGSQILIYLITGYVLQSAYMFRGVLTTASMLILTVAFGTIPRLYRLLYYLLSMGLMFALELLLDVVIIKTVPTFVSVASLSIPAALIFKIFSFVLVTLGYALPYWFCTRKFKKTARHEMSMYIPFLVIQAIMVVLPTLMALSVTDNYVVINVTASLYLFANVVMDFLLVRTFDRINQAHELRLREEQAQNMLQTQVDHYNQLLSSTRTTQQLRHDMKNQLQTLDILLEGGELQTARAQLSSFRERLGNAGENSYTGNPVVDAVIQSKVDACEEKGTHIRCEGSLPRDLAVKAISLCSIAANLLDNAIAAVEKLPPQQERDIRFHAQVQDDRVIFVCENPAVSDALTEPRQPELEQEHGWGLGILKSVAEEYGGGFHLTQQEGTVKAVLWLLPETEQS